MCKRIGRAFLIVLTWGVSLASCGFRVVEVSARAVEDSLGDIMEDLMEILGWQA